jgi:hypothetical protein
VVYVAFRLQKVHFKMKKVYKEGDEAWIYMGVGNLIKGRVVHSFRLENYLLSKYVIEILTGADSVLEVRDWHTMSPSKDQNIGIYSGLACRVMDTMTADEGGG